MAATKAHKAIYRECFLYKKAGVILGDITDGSSIRHSLFEEIKNRPARHRLMKKIDELNHRFGLKTVRLVAEKEPK